jgi:hypothetical protein
MPLSSRKWRLSTATVATRTPSAVEVGYKPALVDNCGLQLVDAQIEARDRLSRCGYHLTLPWSPWYALRRKRVQRFSKSW